MTWRCRAEIVSDTAVERWLIDWTFNKPTVIRSSDLFTSVLRISPLAPPGVEVDRRLGFQICRSNRTLRYAPRRSDTVTVEWTQFKRRVRWHRSCGMEGRLPNTGRYDSCRANHSARMLVSGVAKGERAGPDPPLLFIPLLGLSQIRWIVFFHIYGGGILCMYIVTFTAHQQRNMVRTPTFLGLATPLMPANGRNGLKL